MQALLELMRGGQFMAHSTPMPGEAEEYEASPDPTAGYPVHRYTLAGGDEPQ